MRGAVLTLLGAACGRLDFVPVSGDALGVDGADSFGAAPAPLAALQSAGLDNDPALTADELEIVFASDRPGGTGMVDLYIASRPTRDAAFTTPVEITELNSMVDDNAPELTPDGLTIYFARSGDIYRATRSARGQPWSVPMLATDLNSAQSERPGRIIAAGTAFYLARATVARPNDLDLWVAHRASTAAPWDPAVRIAELSTTAIEGDMWVDDSELLTYFSLRTTSTDLYMSTRSGTAALWGAPQPVTDLNTAGEDADPWLSPDGARLYFSQDVAAGDRDLFVVPR